MRQRTTRLARWAVALVVVGLVVSLVDVDAVRIRLAATDLRLAIPAVAGLVLVHVIAAAAWRRLLRELAGVSLGWRSTLRLYYGAQVFGTVTPGNLGADVYRVVAVGGASRAQLAQPVLLQRLTSVVALVCLGVAGGMVLPIPWLRPYLLPAVVIGGTVGLLGGALVRPDTSGWLGRAVRRLGWSSHATPGTRLRSAIRDGLGLGLVFHGASLVLGLVLVRAVDASATEAPWLVLGALAVARVSLAVPISPNGIGVQEGLLAVLFVQLGLPAETAIAAALLNRLGFLLTAAVGAIALLAPGGTGVNVAQPSRPAARG
jgi:glycosyltransferase 2 family protein